MLRHKYSFRGLSFDYASGAVGGPLAYDYGFRLYFKDFNARVNGSALLQTFRGFPD